MEDLFNLGVKAIIKNNVGNILVLKVSQKAANNVKGYKGDIKYDIPGGRVEKGDTIEMTLVKEIKEETGLDLSTFKYLTTVFSPIRLNNSIAGDVGLILAIYDVTVVGDQINLDDENDSYEWVSPIQASTMFGDKYPAEFCEKIRNLDNK